MYGGRWMNFQVKDKITWVGKIDWELKMFHGEEYSTHRGSTYNSYLVQDEKNVLIDTVWIPYAEEFIENLKQVIDLKKLTILLLIMVNQIIVGPSLS